MSFPPNIEDDRTFADLVGDDQERGGGHIALIMMMLVMMMLAVVVMTMMVLVMMMLVVVVMVMMMSVMVMLVVVVMMMIRKKGKASHGSLCSAIRRQSPENDDFNQVILHRYLIMKSYSAFSLTARSPGSS